MSRQWKPGDVALVDSWRGKGQIAFRCERIEGTPTWCVLDGTDSRGLDDGEITAARLAVVLDLSEQPAPSDPAQRTEAHHLIDMLRETAEQFFVPDAAALARKVADQIEAQVGPRQLKPEEPTGLGAVVEDVNGGLWTSAYRDGGSEWVPSNGARPSEYIDINVVRVLSEGVQP